MSTNDGTINNEVEPGLDGLLPLSIARSQTETATTRLPSVKSCGHATRAGLNVNDQHLDLRRHQARCARPLLAADNRHRRQRAPAELVSLLPDNAAI
jgi:hypothetical protein